jgi:hypothetical protein
VEKQQSSSELRGTSLRLERVTETDREQSLGSAREERERRNE